MNKVELLLPVGNYQMCLAAIHNGADAIYVGMPGFNARGRTHDHDWDDLQEIVETCHLYDVKVHLAFNILIFETELNDAINGLDKAISLGIDALIVQDLGLARLIRSRYPKAVIHGSTQMSLTNYEGIELLDDLNIKRFVLGRENSLREIEIIKSKTKKEIEVFVHGALCVAYSGQCFTSEALGGRSANRGQCAQSCRFDYELYVDNRKQRLIGQKYLVSPQDLCGINEVSELKRIGVDSFKIEGRLKSPEYVATTAKSYTMALSGKNITEQDIANLAVTYSRGFYSGWLHGVAHQKLAPGYYNSNRGQFLGRLKLKSVKELYLDTNINLNAGDGLLFVSEGTELGDKIYTCDRQEKTYKLGMGPKLKASALIGKEVDVYLTRSEGLIKEVKKSVVDKNRLKRIPIKIEILGDLGTPLVLKAFAGDVSVIVQSENDLEVATGKKLDKLELIKKIESLSHTVYESTEILFNLNEEVFLHNRLFKELKQELISKLNNARLMRQMNSPHEIVIQKNHDKKIVKTNGKLNILVRKIEQVIAVVDFFKEHAQYIDHLGFVILDFEFGKDYFSAVNLLKENSIPVAIATTRILKPEEYHNFRLIERCAPDGILIRNLGALNYFKKSNFELLGDFSLNCANSVTHDYLLSKGLTTQCASYDLNINELSALIKNTDSSKLEITIHQYMPEFHMEHCVFAAFLSKGNSFRDCGKPCEKHDVYLKDMYGHRHEIKADQECRNTMFRAKAQSTVKYLDDWQSLGVNNFRFECLHESAQEVVSKIRHYFNILSGEISASDVFERVGSLESHGIGVGQIENKRKYKDRKKFKI